MNARTETRGPALGNLSRDILCLLWTRPGLNGRNVANILGIDHEALMVQKHIDGLARKGVIAYLSDPVGWAILDTEATKAALARPPRNDGWVRLLSNGTVLEPCSNTYAAARAKSEAAPDPCGQRSSAVPTLLSPAELAANAAEVRRKKGRGRCEQGSDAASAAVQAEHTPQLTGERARIAHFALPSQGGVVIRAGALDALRLQARRHSPGADPAAYLGLRD